MPDRPTIEVPTPAGGWGQPWPSVAEIERVFSHERWTLVGGLMAQLHCVHAGFSPVRPTNDVDMVLHIETERGLPAAAAHALESIGYELVVSIDPHDRTAHRVKHLATVEWGHFGAAFGRPFPPSLPWVDDPAAEPNADMWVAPGESRDQIVRLYQQISTRADAVIDELPLDAVGHVPWWPPDASEVTLQHILLHTIAESHRHAGHADIVRELVDGSAGLLDRGDMLPDGDQAWWQRYRDRVEQAARQAADA